MLQDLSAGDAQIVQTFDHRWCSLTCRHCWTKSSWRSVTVSGAINPYFVLYLERVYQEIKQIELAAHIFMASKLNRDLI